MNGQLLQMENTLLNLLTYGERRDLRHACYVWNKYNIPSQAFIRRLLAHHCMLQKKSL